MGMANEMGGRGIGMIVVVVGPSMKELSVCWWNGCGAEE